MRIPIRLLCRDCLRSVDQSCDNPPPSRCPVCGGVLDDESAGPPTSQHDTPGPLGSGGPTAPTPWDETWRRGNLGQLGRFQFRDLLGDGGYGHVYLAYDPRLDRDVAVKVLKPQHAGERFMGRFFREARAAARLDHPNIVSVYDAGRDADRCWIAYQYVKGLTLTRYRDVHRPDAREATRLVRDLADALDHAHRRGVSHRDLKPGNVLIDEHTNPRLTDFGLARRLDCDSDLTLEGTVLGTPAYMSPEQAAGNSHHADARSDVFSLGVIFYELLCGRRPVDLPSGVPGWQMAASASIASPRSIERSVPRALDRICRKALAHDPSSRYPDARAMVDDLDRWLGRKVFWRELVVLASGLAIGLGLALPRVSDQAPAMYLAASPARPGPAPADEPSPDPHTSASAHPAQTPAGPAPIVVNKARRTVHRSTCSYATEIYPDNRLLFPTLADSTEAGYTDFCKKCKPGELLEGEPAPPTP